VGVLAERNHCDGTVAKTIFQAVFALIIPSHLPIAMTLFTQLPWECRPSRKQKFLAEHMVQVFEK